jgi:hypothetical protein
MKFTCSVTDVTDWQIRKKKWKYRHQARRRWMCSLHCCAIAMHAHHTVWRQSKYFCLIVLQFMFSSSNWNVIKEITHERNTKNVHSSRQMLTRRYTCSLTMYQLELLRVRWMRGRVTTVRFNWSLQEVLTFSIILNRKVAVGNGELQMNYLGLSCTEIIKCTITFQFFRP